MVIDGILTRELNHLTDARGGLVEIYRYEWGDDCDTVQWNVVHSRENVIRGVHVHADHFDYLVVLSGTLVLGLHDIRTDSTTHRESDLITLEGNAPCSISIPPGVCHGFYFPVPTVYIYGLSAYWTPTEDLGCRYDCPELGLRWPSSDPVLSARDAAAGSFDAMNEAFQHKLNRQAAETLV
ncbi:dTDP-4-dehydrorhamnose 3,5-epimerase family protein [Breoghania sp. L-A4]|uniref:dTDP-4-dehydrorhamnose 3,5-epimerase family protein n=1 Tax=Breoghania sp. L-A4 TaxID=2304600 RepID=UPI000E360062|nr:dTDP-4-dehydrorhamnose 3,5-epimerase family protein [Breoghania sp. L-A4]AXS42659.1 hypothetical protein D1F64_15870 [Breoghania sp. L-A4]